MKMSTIKWHERYQQQARWTQSIRKYIYEKAGITNGTRILDIGCGTGVLEHELEELTPSTTIGLDIDVPVLDIAKTISPSSVYAAGDAHHLPIASKIFDISLCHFLLLWVKHPLEVLKEMVRVTRPAGYILILAEPDYGGRIDFPSTLSRIGAWQSEALRDQGANPWIGRELRALLTQAGLEDVETGVLGGQWGENSEVEELKLEWEVIQSDLQLNHEFRQHGDALYDIELTARQTHQRILFVPTFYAFGRVRG
jgi:ubiquinone/menaquinone biosynthesis C-methylase UbiE